MDKTFEQYPNLKEYFTTSDGEKFYNDNSAQLHARTLKDKAVQKVERPAGKVVKLPTDAPKSEMEKLADALIALGVAKIPAKKADREKMLAKLKADADAKAKEEADAKAKEDAEATAGNKEVNA